VLDTPATIRFKLFGDTVNTASRMQSLSLPGKVQVSEKTYKKLIGGTIARSYVFSAPRQVQAKGKGVMNTWFLERQRTGAEVLALSHDHSGDADTELFLDVDGNEIAGLGER
jgi:class 3 adenylate cyclase